MLIGKIVSGGQTGVDRVSTEAEPSCRRQALAWCALEAAFDLGFPYGGLIPKGRLAEEVSCR